jgi:hypothetical protein
MDLISCIRRDEKKVDRCFPLSAWSSVSDPRLWTVIKFGFEQRTLISFRAASNVYSVDSTHVRVNISVNSVTLIREDSRRYGTRNRPVSKWHWLALNRRAGVHWNKFIDEKWVLVPAEAIETDIHWFHSMKVNRHSELDNDANNTFSPLSTTRRQSLVHNMWTSDKPSSWNKLMSVQRSSRQFVVMIGNAGFPGEGFIAR